MLYGHIHSMLIDSGIGGALRNNIWVVAAIAATTLDGILVRADGTSPNDFFGREWDSSWIKQENLANRVSYLIVQKLKQNLKIVDQECNGRIQ